MLCPVCNKNPIKPHPIYGALPCSICALRRSELKSPDHLYEFTSSQIKKERIEYNKDITQPFRGNEASKEFMDAHPEKAKKIFSKKEIANIKNVWN